MESEASVMFQGVAKTSAAFRLMQQMGWEEGHGLGKNKQGMKEHLRVRKKQDNAGLGLDQKAKAAANWALNTTAYDTILKNLKVQVAVKTSKDEEEEDDISSAPKPESSGPTEGTSDREEVKIKKVSRPQGRYKKREQGKMVRGYSETDLAAILGAVIGKTVPEIPKKAITSSEEAIKDESHPSCSKKRLLPEVVECIIIPDLKKTTKSKSKSKSKDEAMKESQQNDWESATPSFPPLPDDWWGNKYGFVRAGSLGATSGVSKVPNPSVRTAFREQDQEDLYNLVQDKATTGKKGLGIGDRPRKVGGAHFKGQKKVFDSSDDEDEDGSETDLASNRHEDSTSNDACDADKSSKRKNDTDRMGDKAEIIEQDPPLETKSNKWRKDGDGKKVVSLNSRVEEEASEGKLESSSQWKKLCRELLAVAPSQTLSFKRLQKRVIAAGFFSGETQTSVEDRWTNLKEKLQKSSRFVVEGKMVSLAAGKVGA